MSVKALRNQLLAAIAMVLVAAIALGSSTFAWFASNQTVQVKGMEVNTKVSDNLMISWDNTEANYSVKLLNQTRQAKLEPVSTVNATNFFYHDTLNIAGTGETTAEDFIAYAEDATPAVANSAAEKTTYDDDFQTNYGFTDAITSSNIGNAYYGYVDYTFFVKATNSTASAQSLFITKFNLLYNNTAITEKAWRAAIFVNPIAKDAADDGTLGTLVTVLKPNTATNFAGADKAVTATDRTTARAAVTNANAAATIADANLAAKSTQRYKITVRLWLEGEDTTCNNETFATLTNAWNLELQIDLSSVTGAAPVNLIQSDASWHATETPVINDPGNPVSP